MEEGIVPPGVALLRARQAIANLKGANHDQDASIKIVVPALEEPLRQIVANTDDERSVVVAKVLEGKGSYGWNAATREYGDLVKMGVIDPTKVTRYALQNAASVAGLILTTDAVVAKLPKDAKPAPMPYDGGDMDIDRALRNEPPLRRGLFLSLAYPLGLTCASATPAAAVGFWPCLVNAQRLAVKVLAVEPGDRCERVGLAGHLDEAEAFGGAGEHLPHDLDRLDVSERLECLSQFGFGGLRCEVADEDVHLVLLVVVERC